MTSKERVLRAIRHEEVDRTPYFHHGAGINGRELAIRLGVAMDEETIQQALGTDVRYVRVQRFLDGPGRCYYDYGNVHAILQKEKGCETIVMRKLPLEDMKTMDAILACRHWSSPDWFDYAIPRDYAQRVSDKAVVAHDMGIIFLVAMSLRGMEQVMVDMIESPDIAHAIFSRIADFNCERIRRFVAANEGLFDIVGIGDDVAGQNGMFFSLDMWREFLKPYVNKMADLCHELGVIPYFHGCGGFRELFHDFIEMGIPCTGRLQTEAKGNNFAEIKKEFGKDLCLWGAIDAQHICVSGTADDVRTHIKSLFAANSDHTGFVAGQTHVFTDDTPTDNMMAVYEALRDENS